MKKSRLLMVAPAVAMLLTACGGQPSSSGTVQEGGFMKENVTIELWHTFNDTYTAVLNNFVEAFKKVEPNITVNLVKQSGNYDALRNKISQGFTADNYPDLAICYPDHVADYLDYGKAVQLDQFMDNPEYGWTAEEKADVVENYLLEGQGYDEEGGTYSLPFAKSTEAMFYNKDALLNRVLPNINNGQAITERYLNDLTWDELFNNLCPALVKANDALGEKDKFYRPGTDDKHGIVGYDSDDNLFITLAQQYGYDYTDTDPVTRKGIVKFNNPEMKALMKTFRAAKDKDYFITKGVSGDFVNKMFVERKTLFSIGSTGGTKHQFTTNFNVGVLKIPHATGKSPFVINQGPSLCMLDHGSENRQIASWLFYKFATNTKNATTWGIETSYMPVRYSSYSTPEYLAFSDPSDQEGEDKLLADVATYNPTVQNDLFVSPVFKGSSTCRNQAASIMTQCLTSEDFSDAKIDEIFAAAENLAKLAL